MSDGPLTVFAVTRDQIANALTGLALAALDGDRKFAAVVADPGKVADTILANAVTPTAQDFDRAAGEISAVDMLGVAVNELEEIAAAPDLRTAQITAAGALDIIRNRFTGDGEWKLVSRAQPGPEQPQGGQWERIAFMGHIEYTGRVTRFDRYGEPAYRIELPDLVFGGNPLAWREHRASMWFSSEPVSEESARAAWEAQQERAAQQAREEAEWHARQQRALEAANDDDESQGEPF